MTAWPRARHDGEEAAVAVEIKKWRAVEEKGGEGVGIYRGGFDPSTSHHPGPKGVLAGRGENAPAAHL